MKRKRIHKVDRRNGRGRLVKLRGWSAQALDMVNFRKGTSNRMGSRKLDSSMLKMGRGHVERVGESQPVSLDPGP